MSERTAYKYGDIVAVSGYRIDNRRWMVVVVASTPTARPWKLVSLSEKPILSTWENLYGFVRVDLVESYV